MCPKGSGLRGFSGKPVGSAAGCRCRDGFHRIDKIGVTDPIDDEIRRQGDLERALMRMQADDDMTAGLIRAIFQNAQGKSVV